MATQAAAAPVVAAAPVATISLGEVHYGDQVVPFANAQSFTVNGRQVVVTFLSGDDTLEIPFEHQTAARVRLFVSKLFMETNAQMVMPFVSIVPSIPVVADRLHIGIIELRFEKAEDQELFQQYCQKKFFDGFGAMVNNIYYKKGAIGYVTVLSTRVGRFAEILQVVNSHLKKFNEAIHGEVVKDRLDETCDDRFVIFPDEIPDDRYATL